MPCVFISHASIALYAAEIIKSIFPNYIQIVLVAHRDIEEDYEKFVFWSDRVDKIVCISQKIMNQFQGKYKLGQNLLIYKPNPINIPQGYKKKEINKKGVKNRICGQVGERGKEGRVITRSYREMYK